MSFSFKFGENGETGKKLTYADLTHELRRPAGALRFVSVQAIPPMITQAQSVELRP